ncbi:hypothetical protein B0H13DRAFT_1854849 [Mycena leptocephala]|nr:hypothetical protein B0H13DRAFT_1854849 [Mycena leptocephala]
MRLSSLQQASCLEVLLAARFLTIVIARAVWADSRKRPPSDSELPSAPPPRKSKKAKGHRPDTEDDVMDVDKVLAAPVSKKKSKHENTEAMAPETLSTSESKSKGTYFPASNPSQCSDVPAGENQTKSATVGIPKRMYILTINTDSDKDIAPEILEKPHKPAPKTSAAGASGPQVPIKPRPKSKKTVTSDESSAKSQSDDDKDSTGSMPGDEGSLDLQAERPLIISRDGNDDLLDFSDGHDARPSMRASSGRQARAAAIRPCWALLRVRGDVRMGGCMAQEEDIMIETVFAGLLKQHSLSDAVFLTLWEPQFLFDATGTFTRVCPYLPLAILLPTSIRLNSEMSTDSVLCGTCRKKFGPKGIGNHRKACEEKHKNQASNKNFREQVRRRENEAFLDDVLRLGEQQHQQQYETTERCGLRIGGYIVETHKCVMSFTVQGVHVGREASPQLFLPFVLQLFSGSKA